MKPVNPHALFADALKNVAGVAVMHRRLAGWIDAYPSNHGEFPLEAAQRIALDLCGLAAVLEQTHSALSDFGVLPGTGGAMEN